MQLIQLHFLFGFYCKDAGSGNSYLIFPHSRPDGGFITKLSQLINTFATAFKKHLFFISILNK